MSDQHIVVCGYGPGIGDAVARRFGEAGFHVSLVGRNEQRLHDAVAELSKTGVSASGIRADLGVASEVARAIDMARERGGPLTVIHWNAVYPGAGDLLHAPISELESIAGLGLVGPLVAARSAAEDLRAAEQGSILFTGGGLASDAGDSMAVQYSMAGIALGKALHRKLAGLLNIALENSNVYVGELAVLGMVRGPSNPAGTIDPTAIAERLYDMHRSRKGAHHQIAGESP